MRRASSSGWIAAVAAALAVVACSRDGGQPAERTPAPSPPAPAPGAARPAAGDAVLLGVVHEAGQRVCRADGTEQWINRHHEIGFVRALPGDGVDEPLAALRRKPVLARGRAAERAPALTDPPPADAVDCPIAQMRSDWVESPEGMRMRRGDGPGIAAFEVDRVEAFDGLRVVVEGARLRVTLTNTLGVALAGPVALVVHYEGCYGKPGATMQSVVDDDGLAPGETLTGELPTIAEADRVPGNPKGTREHRAYSIELRAGGDRVYVDFDLPLAALGASVSCPE